MPSKNPAQRLRDIVENMDVIEEFTAKVHRGDDGFPAFKLIVFLPVIELLLDSIASEKLTSSTGGRCETAWKPNRAAHCAIEVR